MDDCRFGTKAVFKNCSEICFTSKYCITKSSMQLGTLPLEPLKYSVKMGGAPCVSVSLDKTSIKVPDMTFTVGKLTPVTHSFNRADLKDSTFGTGTECGLRNFVLKEAEKFKTFITLQQYAKTVTLQF
jgi:hypothetical protein